MFYFCLSVGVNALPREVINGKRVIQGIKDIWLYLTGSPALISRILVKWFSIGHLGIRAENRRTIAVLLGHPG